MTRPRMITGPTGWIGRALLARVTREGGLDRVRLFGSSARTILAPDGTPLPMRALAEIGANDVADADVIHLAYLTKEKAELLGEAAFAAGNRAIDGALLAAIGQARPHALFIASSGAARLAEEGRDLHPYGVAKLAQERAFLAYGLETGVPVTVARIFALAGPHINKVESYAIASFLTQAFATGRIRIAAARPVYRSYLHVDDLAGLALRLLDAGLGAPAAIDFCGSEILEMGEIAGAVARLVGLPQDAIERPSLNFDDASAYLGDPVAMRTLALRLGQPLADFATQLRDTARFLREAAAEG